MKKINYLLIAAIASLTVASCQKEQAEQFTPAGQGAGQEFTVSLPEVTKTALVEGKTVWAKNDSLWISNGTLTEKIGVPEESWGQKSFTFKTKGTMITSETPNMYVVYPYEAASGVKEGKLSVKIPGFQKGEFNEANIVAAQTTTYSVSLKNVTAILKVTVPPQAETKNTPIYSLAIGATNGNALSGTCTVDFSGSDPVLTPTAKSTSISAQIDGLDDKDFYFAVIPGTYDAGFTLTAATTSFENASETKTTKSAKTVKVNELVNLGSIGTDLKPLPGAGTETDPWQIESLGHMIALASAVAEGNTFEGKYLKVMNDISGITMPVGYFPNASNNHPFKGDFDGNNKTLTIDIDGAAQPATIRLGLFGAVADGANLHDMTIKGTVTSTGDALGALAGRVDVSSGTVTIKNITSEVVISGPQYLGGLVGWVNLAGEGSTVFENCANKGGIKGTNFLGGILGASNNVPKKDKLSFTDCTNEGSIDGGHYLGGIVGQLQASANTNTKDLTRCTNKGTINGKYCVGGICGYSYVAVYDNCKNEGVIVSTDQNGHPAAMSSSGTVNVFTSANGYTNGTGGITGYAQNCTIKNCNNTGSITAFNKVGGISGSNYWTGTSNCTNSGTIKATNKATLTWYNLSCAGGIIGWIYQAYNITDCTNSGNVSGAGGTCGGIVGAMDMGRSTGSGQAKITNCTNEGQVSGNGMGVGGIAGRIMPNSTRGYTLSNCKNAASATVSNASNSTGGIVGVIIATASNTKTTVLDNCVNEALIKGMYSVGGLVGQSCSWLADYLSFTIRNCENKGDLLVNRGDGDNGEYAGGIIGHVIKSDTKGSASASANIYNCLNSGKIEYSQTTHKTLYIGGIVGKMPSGTIENVVNHGYVGPKDDAALADGAKNYLGTVIGSLENTATLKEGYYLATTKTGAVGAAKNQPAADDNVVDYNADGELSMPIKIGESNYSLVDEALNAWVTLNKTTELPYFSWTWSTGPAFVKE